MHPIVFILGCPRSGTSAIARGLRQALGYKGYREGHLASELFKLAGEVAERFESARQAIGTNDRIAAQALPNLATRFMIEAVSADELFSQFGQMARRIYTSLLTPPWYDKTAGAPMLDAIPHVAAAFPEARFIYMHRRMHEVVASHARKFAGISPLDAAGHWAHCKLLWDRNRPSVAGRFIEIDQRGVLLAPFSTARQLQHFLLFDDAGCDRLAKVLAQTDTERTADNTAAPLSSETLKLSAEQRAALRATTADAMNAYGYDFDRQYCRGDPKIAYLVRGDEGSVTGGRLRGSGDSAFLVADPDAPGTEGWVRVKQIEAGQRLKAVLLRLFSKHKSCLLRIGLATADGISEKEWICNLSDVAGGELDLALPSARDVQIKFALAASGEDAPLRLELRGLRLEGPANKAPDPDEVSSALPLVPSLRTTGLHPASMFR